MCTAISLKTDDFYFGRTLDNEFSYGEQVCITPRNFEFKFKHVQPIKTHYAIIGMAFVKDDYPLYYDAANEKGLCIAGLNFVGNAHYNDTNAIKDNIAVFELIPWILCLCANISEVKAQLKKLNLTNTAFSNQLPPAQLHWLIADNESCITLESTKEGLKVYDNPIGVLTNNPPFDMQLFSLNDYMHLNAKQPQNTFSNTLNLNCYSKGMGAIGLPGDLSSRSRFVRACFTKANSVCDTSESVSQFFHIMETVSQTKGCNLSQDKYEITIYTSCCNANKGIYYYTTYGNRQINAVNMHNENLNGNALIAYSLENKENTNYQN